MVLKQENCHGIRMLITSKKPAFSGVKMYLFKVHTGRIFGMVSFRKQCKHIHVLQFWPDCTGKMLVEG